MKKLIEWAEKDILRARKLMLFSTIFVYLFITVTVMFLVALGFDMKGFETIYYSLSTVAAVAIGFYTGTTAKGVNIKDGTLENEK